MNCHEAAERMIDLFDVETIPSTEPVLEHLRSCTECGLRFEQERRTFEAIRPVQRIMASQRFKEKAMKAIIAEAARESVLESRTRWRCRGWPKWVAAVSAAVLLLLMLAMLRVGKGGSRAAEVKLLAQSVDVMSNVRTVHMIGRMRTLAGDNFELVGTDYEFVPLELWREYDNPPRWRVEKTGRVVVMDGQSSLLYVPGRNMAMKGTPETGFVEWLPPLLSPETILQAELAAARQGTAEAKLVESEGILTLTVRRKARGDFANPWAKDRSIQESDHICVYRFDAATKRLEGLQVIMTEGAKDVSVLELTDFRYNESFPPSLFALQLPSDVHWALNATDLRPAPATLTGPGEVAEYFFDALAREDWDAVLEVLPFSRADDRFRQTYGGLQVVSIGQPFKSGLYPGYFVPYKIRLRDGSTREWKLSVRNDNPTHRWTVDGGF
jgi:outer membrane lipoprotein-sorting protein